MEPEVFSFRKILAVGRSEQASPVISVCHKQRGGQLRIGESGFTHNRSDGIRWCRRGPNIIFQKAGSERNMWALHTCKARKGRKSWEGKVAIRNSPPPGCVLSWPSQDSWKFACCSLHAHFNVSLQSTAPGHRFQRFRRASSVASWAAKPNVPCQVFGHPASPSCA